MEIIEVKNLTKSYKDVRALDGVSLSIKKGEFFSVLGENGAGKSTLIKIISGITDYDSGEVKVLKKDVNNLPLDIKKEISVLPQENAIIDNLTVYQNLELILKLYGKEKNKIKEIIEQNINKFGLKEVINKRAKTLSGGIKRRLSIAMSLMLEPKIVFLDEPTVALDVFLRREIWEIIKELKGKTTVILTTHYLEEAESLSDRVAILYKGKILDIDSVENMIIKTNSKNLEDAFIKIIKGEKL